MMIHKKTLFHERNEHCRIRNSMRSMSCHSPASTRIVTVKSSEIENDFGAWSHLQKRKQPFMVVIIRKFHIGIFQVFSHFIFSHFRWKTRKNSFIRIMTVGIETIVLNFGSLGRVYSDVTVFPVWSVIIFLFPFRV